MVGWDGEEFPTRTRSGRIKKQPGTAHPTPTPELSSDQRAAYDGLAGILELRGSETSRSTAIKNGVKGTKSGQELLAALGANQIPQTYVASVLYAAVNASKEQAHLYETVDHLLEHHPLPNSGDVNPSVLEALTNVVNYVYVRLHG